MEKNNNNNWAEHLLEAFHPVRVSSFKTCLKNIRIFMLSFHLFFNGWTAIRTFRARGLSEWMRLEVCAELENVIVFYTGKKKSIKITKTLKVVFQFVSQSCCHGNIVGVTVEHLLYEYDIYMNFTFSTFVEYIIVDRSWIFYIQNFSVSNYLYI